jgi:hypothetical protein
MAPRSDAGAAERARSATQKELAELVYSRNEEVLAALLENPRFDENLLCRLLDRKDTPGVILEQVARTRTWMRSYRVKLRVASHPHTPRLTAVPLVRQLYLFDLVTLSLVPSVPAEMKRLAEDLVINRLPQLPLGQKFTLARRGSARVAAALLAEGLERVVGLSLDNPFLTEAQVLKTLARDGLPESVVAAVARHRKWSYLYNVRMALVRHPLTPLARVLGFLGDLTLRDLEELSAASTLGESLRRYLRHEIARRRGRSRARRSASKSGAEAG